jgi:hypothetical protein
MRNNRKDDEDILAFEFSDEALEITASATTDAAATLGGPTVSIFVMCCGSEWRDDAQSLAGL